MDSGSIKYLVICFSLYFIMLLAALLLFCVFTFDHLPIFWMCSLYIETWELKGSCHTLAGKRILFLFLFLNIEVYCLLVNLMNLPDLYLRKLKIFTLLNYLDFLIYKQLGLSILCLIPIPYWPMKHEYHFGAVSACQHTRVWLRHMTTLMLHVCCTCPCVKKYFLFSGSYTAWTCRGHGQLPIWNGKR